MNQFTILVPKRISDIWPVTEFLFDKLGIGYNPNSTNYTVKTRYSGVDLAFKLGRPEDWLTVLDYLGIDASVTGKDLIVNNLIGKYYIQKKSRRLL